MSQTERVAHGNKIGKFLIQSKRIREAVVRNNEPDGTERMNRFRLLVDIATLYESDKACKIFREFIEFQNDYKDYQRWKKNRLEKDSRPDRGASGSSNTFDRSADPYYQQWFGQNYNSSAYSGGYSGNFGIDTMGISSIFQTGSTNRDNDEKLNHDDESDIDDFDELDSELYYDLLDRSCANINRSSRLVRATRGTRRFYTDIEFEDDEEKDKSENESTDKSDDKSDDKSGESKEDYTIDASTVTTTIHESVASGANEVNKVGEASVA